MAGGQWSTAAPPARMGAYFNFVAALQAIATAGATGVAAIIGTSDWGPVGEAQTVTSQGDFEGDFGKGTGTLRDGVLAALEGMDDVGGATSVLAYRAALATAAEATVDLMDDAAAPAVTITARYPGTRGNNFTVQVQTHPTDETLKDLSVYESGTLLQSFIALANTNDAFVAAINDADSPYITAALAGAAARPVANVATVALADGDSGTAITVTEIAAAQNALAQKDFDSVSLSAISDDPTLDAFCAWVDDTLNAHGRRCFGIIGGAASETYADAKSRSIGGSTDVSADSGNIINVGAVDITRLSDGVVLSPAQLAPRVAGVVAGVGFRRSLTNIRWEGYQVAVPLTDTEYTSAIADGILTFSNDTTTRVVIEMGVTSQVTVTKGEGSPKPAANQKIRNVAVQHFIEKTLTRVAKDDYIGDSTNTDTTINDLIAAFLQFLKILEGQGVLVPGTSTIVLDPAFVSTGNAVFLKYTIVHADTLERIFSTVRVS